MKKVLKIRHSRFFIISLLLSPFLILTSDNIVVDISSLVFLFVISGFYGLFCMTKSIDLYSNSIVCNNIFGSKSIIKLESISIVDLFLVNYVIFVGYGGSKVVIFGVENINKVKEFRESIGLSKK